MLESLKSEFSPELHLLLASALPPRHEAEIERLTAYSLPDIDWHTFIALVERHHLVPTVYRSLSTHAASNVPQPVLAGLKDRAERNRQRILQLLMELGRISERFAQAGIPVCTLKGPVLAQRLFGDASLRASTDLDLLVPLDSLAQADALLLQYGCQRVFPAAPLTPRQQRAFQQEWYNYTYFLPGPRIFIELHWTIASPDLVALQAVEQMLSRLQPLPQFGGQLFGLADQDLPVYLLVHGSKHNWVRLKWLVDFAAWLRQASQPDWQALQERMAELDLQRSLGQGAWLVHELLAAPASGALAMPGVQDAQIQRLARRSLKAILDQNYRGGEFGKLQRIKHILNVMQLKSGLRYKWDTLRRFWVLPTDWQDAPLPDALFPLYGLLRPFLWLRRAYRYRRNGLPGARPPRTQ
jgi:hypothetical protein